MLKTPLLVTEKEASIKTVRPHSYKPMKAE